MQLSISARFVRRGENRGGFYYHEYCRAERYSASLGQNQGLAAASRLSLASKILQSLEAEQTRPKKSLADLAGILETDRPPPTDEEVEQILEEERLRKYG